MDNSTTQRTNKSINNPKNYRLMKLFKNIFSWAPTATLAALAFAACTDTVVDETPFAAQNEAETAVTFGTYLGKQSTRAGYEGNISDAELKTQHFGVFAYYTGTNTYGQQQHSTYTAESGSATNIAPNFMYNQEVTWESSKWTYTPLKYWPNDFANTAVDDNSPAATGSGTQGGNVSFFAYAPYVPSAAASDGITDMSANDDVGDPTIEYTIPTDINTGGSFVDLLWGTASGTSQNAVTASTNTGVTGNSDGTDGLYATAVLNGQTVNADLNKQKTDGTVGFLFKHALAKIGGYGDDTKLGFLVKLDINNNTDETGGTREAFDTDDDSENDAWRTIVTIKSITITNDLNGDDDAEDSGETGIGGTQTLNLATGQWTTTANTTYFKQTIGGPETSTTYNATINTKIAEYQATGTPDVTWFSYLTASNVQDYFIYDNAEDATKDHPGVMESAMPVYNSTSQSPIVLFPGTAPKFKITVDYIVRTYDASLSTKCTTVEQIITKQVQFPTVEMNKYYSILMHLGLEDINFTATVAEWDTDYDGNGSTTIDDAIDVDLPINVE